MTDIVERLRLVTGFHKPMRVEDYKEAADEIERLRKELDFIHTELDKVRQIMREPT